MSLTIWLLDTFPTWALTVVVIAGPTLLAVAGAAIARSRVKDWDAVAERSDFGAALFSVIATIYSIFLAFTVVIAWEQLGEADETVAEEASTLLAVYRDAGAFPNPSLSEIQGRARDYARAVVDHEWDTMAHGEASPRAEAELDRLWEAVLRYEPQNEKQTAIYSELYGRLNDLGRFRQLRILDSQQSIPSFFWMALIGVGMLTVGYTYFLGLRQGGIQLAMVGFMTATIASALLLTLLLDHPFTGEIRAEPDAFVAALQRMRG